MIEKAVVFPSITVVPGPGLKLVTTVVGEFCVPLKPVPEVRIEALNELRVLSPPSAWRETEPPKVAEVSNRSTAVSVPRSLSNLVNEKVVLVVVRDGVEL